MSKQIGIFGFKTGENSFGVTVPYYEYFDFFGDVHIISPLANVVLAGYDLIVVPGGPDVSPNSYGHVPDMRTSKSDPIREYFDQHVLPEAIEAGIPIVGICRGHQAIGVLHGSAMHQHMYHSTSKTRGELSHGIAVFTKELPEPLGATLRNKLSIKKEKNKGVHPLNRHLEVNSLHHQTLSDIPDSAILLASHFDDKKPNDSSIEALFYPDHNIVTFQYHPEEIWDELSILCIKYLLSLKNGKNKNVEAKAQEIST
jgi:gamma-glutamyl-gamma-aminobutyrate hydrolase PuuD